MMNSGMFQGDEPLTMSGIALPEEMTELSMVARKTRKKNLERIAHLTGNFIHLNTTCHSLKLLKMVFEKNGDDDV